MWISKLPSVLQDVFDTYAHLFPACAACVFERDRVFFAVSGTALTPHFETTHADEYTVFDLASLTKALAAAPSVFLLLQQGRLSLEDPVLHQLSVVRPELAAHLARVTVAHLLNHSAGFPAYAPFFETARSVEDMLVQLGQVWPQSDPGAYFLYSDIGYIFLGQHLSQTVGNDWTIWAKENLFCGFDFSFGEPREDAIWADNREPGCQKRGVHDENARLLGAYCAHAGLFGSLWDVTTWLQRLCRMYTGEESLPLLPVVVRRMWTPLDGKDPFTLGFDRPAASGFTTAGETVDRQAVVGHLGFSGTAFWLHPQRFRGGVLLTNRVALGRYACIEELKHFRSEFFARLWEVSLEN